MECGDGKRGNDDQRVFESQRGRSEKEEEERESERERGAMLYPQVDMVVALQPDSHSSLKLGKKLLQSY